MQNKYDGAQFYDDIYVCLKNSKYMANINILLVAPSFTCIFIFFLSFRILSFFLPCSLKNGLFVDRAFWRMFANVCIIFELWFAPRFSVRYIRVCAKVIVTYSQQCEVVAKAHTHTHKPYHLFVRKSLRVQFSCSFLEHIHFQSTALYSFLRFTNEMRESRSIFGFIINILQHIVKFSSSCNGAKARKENKMKWSTTEGKQFAHAVLQSWIFIRPYSITNISY